MWERDRERGRSSTCRPANRLVRCTLILSLKYRAQWTRRVIAIVAPAGSTGQHVREGSCHPCFHRLPTKVNRCCSVASPADYTTPNERRRFAVSQLGWTTMRAPYIFAIRSRFFLLFVAPRRERGISRAVSSFRNLARFTRNFFTFYRDFRVVACKLLQTSSPSTPFLRLCCRKYRSAIENPKRLEDGR